VGPPFCLLQTARAPPHLVRCALAPEDVAVGEPDALLDVGRTEHLDVLDDLLDVAVAPDRADDGYQLVGNARV
jgi:hypothetical protein